MKTIYDWLCELPEPLNEMAINECLAQDMTVAFTPKSSLSGALWSGFVWCKTIMKGDFWRAVAINAEYIEGQSH